MSPRDRSARGCRTSTLAALAVVCLLLAPAAASAETWKGVPVVDTYCLARVKDDPDKHTTECALQCAKGGYGLLTPEGAFLAFDEAGNRMTVAALKATTRTDHLRASVVGTREGDRIRVESVTLD